MRKKILLVEDNRADAVLVQLAIEESGLDLELDHVSDGQTMLLRMQETSPEDISFILLDLNIPKANGPEILQARSTLTDWSLVPVVVYSSSSRSEDIRTCLAGGANAYICKQVDYERFSEGLKSTFHYWHTIALRT
jgi:two-component system, chemotaxis family, response regulator Rcp1